MKNVIVLGSGRSGTSMVAGTLAAAGYYMGESLVEPRESNPKGFFESRVINRINERIMADAVPTRAEDDASMMHVPLPRQYWLANVPPEAPMRDDASIQREIAEQVAQQPYCFKDPRFCYTLDVWRPLVRKTVYVCVFREPAVTAASILKEVRFAPYLRTMRLSFEQAVALWTAMYRNVIDHLRHEGEWLFVQYEQLLEPAGVERLGAFVDAKLDAGFPEKRLKRTHSDATVGDGAAGVYAQLVELAGA